MTFKAVPPQTFVQKGGTLSQKLFEQFSGVENSMAKLARVPMASGDANAYSFAWQNPEDAPIIVTRVYADVTTAGGTSGAVMDIGTAATAATASDNILDGIGINTAKVYDNITDGGTNGKTVQKMEKKGGTTDHITGRILTQNAAALKGYVYILYIPVSE